MPTFRVDDMTCGDCAAAIAEAVLAVDADATVDISLRRRLVTVESARVDARRLQDAIAAAGHRPVPAEPSADARRAGDGPGVCACCSACACR